MTTMKDGRRQYCLAINSHGSVSIFEGDFVYNTAQMVASRLTQREVFAVDFQNTRYIVDKDDFSRTAVQRWLLKAERSSGNYTVTTISLYDTVPHDDDKED